MKNKLLVLVAMTILMVGCGETFDASTDNLIRVSYNGILETLEGEEKEQFKRQYQFYTEKYELPQDPEDPGIDFSQNDIESLHGLTYGEVVSKVAQHEQYVADIRREKDLFMLREFHGLYLDSREKILSSMKDLPVTLEPMEAKFLGPLAIKAELDNNTEYTIRKFSLEVSVVQRSTGEQVYSTTVFADLGNDPLPPGYSYTSSFGDQKVQEVIQDKNHSVIGYLANVIVDDGRLVYAKMDESNFLQYVSLKRTYPEEFKDIKEELGEPAI
ncbi:MAG: DUF6694 family lipoprotein [Alcanivorax jadensis]|uniref:DUF6694 family lipoprotein n=1 Tax=Alcanivorax jadensis TaxID=64988 RepID=UPI0030016D9D